MPVYVELGLDPKYMMFHSTKVEAPIHVGYERPSFAGVLTGYDARDPYNQYWNVFIRRHDNVARDKTPSPYNNLVRVDMIQSLDTPFAGINAKAYVMCLNAEDATVPPTAAPTAAPTSSPAPEPEEPSTSLIVKKPSGSAPARSMDELKEFFRQSVAGYTEDDKTDIESIILGNDILDFDALNDGDIILGDILSELGITNVTAITLLCKDTDTCGDKISDLYDVIDSVTLMQYEGARRLRDEMTPRRLADVTLLKIDGKKAKKITYGKNTMPKKEKLVIMNCEQLTSLIVQESAFANTIGFYLDNNPALESVFLEKYSFSNKPEAKGILVWDRRVLQILVTCRASYFGLRVLRI